MDERKARKRIQNRIAQRLYRQFSVDHRCAAVFLTVTQVSGNDRGSKTSERSWRPTSKTSTTTCSHHPQACAIVDGRAAKTLVSMDSSLHPRLLRQIHSPPCSVEKTWSVVAVP